MQFQIFRTLLKVKPLAGIRPTGEFVVLILNNISELTSFHPNAISTDNFFPSNNILFFYHYSPPPMQTRDMEFGRNIPFAGVGGLSLNKLCPCGGQV